MKKTIKYAIAATALAAVGATAFAAKRMEANDALNLPAGVITLQQAIQAAQQHVGGGQATKAEFEHNDHNNWVIDVEMVKGQTVTDVQIDAQKGSVLSAKADQADHGDDEDGKDARD